MGNLYEEIRRAEKRARGLDPWDQKCPRKNQRLLCLKKQLQREGIWEADDGPNTSHTVAALMNQLKLTRGLGKLIGPVGSEMRSTSTWKQCMPL
jgi:hypothetical protein